MTLPSSSSSSIYGNSNTWTSDQDMETLRLLLIDKERERQSLANDLDVAARLGLVISETNEALHIKLGQVQQENHDLQQALMYATTPREQLTEELAQARKDLDTFRLEMDGLAGQLVDMTAEIVESRSKVSVYAKRLAEVEHKLTTTRGMNQHLQSLLEKTLLSQKQSSSTTSHLVKNLQADLIKIVTENEQLRHRIVELEQQQMEGEDRLTNMAAQAQDYAALLEQAQNTIHHLGESRLLLEDDEEDDGLSNNDLSTISSSTGYNETITKGAVFSVEFRQEMQKEIERNLQLRHEIRHRIITADPPTTTTTETKKKGQQGLKALLADRDPGLSMLASSSSSTTSTTSTRRSFIDTNKKKARKNDPTNNRSTATPVLHPLNTLRPATFLTGFNDFDHQNPLKRPSFLSTMPRHSTSSSSSSNISTRFFHRIASRFDES